MDEQFLKCRCCGEDEAVANLRTHIWRTHKNKKSKEYKGCVCGLKRCRLTRKPLPPLPVKEIVIETEFLFRFSK